MKFFFLVSFIIACGSAFGQDYIQKDSILSMGIVRVIDDHSIYYKKFKKDRYVRLTTIEVFEYRTQGKIFQRSEHETTPRFYEVGGRSKAATVLLLPTGYLLKTGNSSQVFLTKAAVIEKLREKLDAPSSVIPKRAFNMPRALNHNIEKIIEKDHTKLLFPRFSLVAGTITMNQNMNVATFSTLGEMWKSQTTVPFFGVRYQKPFFNPRNIFFEVQANFFVVNNSLHGAFNRVDLSSVYTVLPINIVWQKQVKNISPYVKGGLVGAYQSVSSPRPIYVLNSAQNLVDSNFLFGFNAGTGMNLDVSKRNRLFIELGWFNLFERQFGNFAIATSGYSLSAGITY